MRSFQRSVILSLLGAALPIVSAFAQVNSSENNALVFTVNDFEHARISGTAGNVGIGTTNPLAKLTVSGNVSVTGIIDVGHTAQACATAISGSIRYETTSDTLQICTGSGWKSLASSTVAATTAASSTGAIQFNSGGSFAGDTSNLFWDDANNRLGVGTSSPLAALQINSGTNKNIQLGDAAGAYTSVSKFSDLTTLYGTLNFSRDTDGAFTESVFNYLGSNSLSNLGLATRGDIKMIVGATADRGMVIKNSGNVGIGTTSPDQALDVVGHVVLSGATSNTIYYGATGVAAPGAGSVGEKIQLYGTPGAASIGDYALGIESGNMWFNTGGGFKWYINGTQYMAMDSSGRVGIGVAPAAAIQSYVITDTTNVASNYASYVANTPRATTTGTYNNAAFLAAVTPIISTGITNSGWAMGSYINALRNNAADIGTLTGLYGSYIVYGHNTGIATARATTSAYGLVVQPYHQNGTITNSYGLLIGNAVTGGTVTNYWGLYQQDSTAKNYFAGNVGIGTTGPGAKMHIVSTSTGAATYPLLVQNASGAASTQVGVEFDPTSNGAGVRTAQIAAHTNGSNQVSMIFRTANATTPAEAMRIQYDGNVGIGTASPGAKLDVSGSIVSRVVNNGSGTTFDLSQGNVQYTSAACGAFTLTNMVDGGSYMIVAKGSGTGPATFTHTGLTAKTTATLTCTSAKHTVFSLTRAGTNFYVTMVTGY